MVKKTVLVNLVFQSGIAYKVDLIKDQPIIPQINDYLLSKNITIEPNSVLIDGGSMISQTDTPFLRSLRRGACLDVLKLYR